MHFFMNHDVGHSTQSSTQTFGAQSTNDFNCTSKFTLTGTDPKKVFAVQTGLLLVQEVGGNIVNAALRPLTNLGESRPSVGLYIYRGLSKSSFIDSSTGKILASGHDDETDFTASIWEAYNQYHTNTNGPLDPSIIGVDGTLNNSITLESIFNGSQAVNAHIVNEGMCIGDWDDTNDIGFEVMLNNHDLEPTIGFLKQSEHTITVTGISNSVEKKAKREECLLFLDPAALYGLHYYDGVDAKDKNLVATPYSEQAEFYEDLIDHFATRNRLYLDVRNEYGYSYNFYENYHDGGSNNVKLGNSTTTPAARAFSSSDWPYVYTDSCPTSGTTSDVAVAFRLAEGSTMDNPKPLVFYAGDLGHDKTWKIVGDTELTNSGSNTDWTEPVSARFPNYDDSGTKKNMAWFIRLHYVRQEPYAGSNGNVPKMESNDHLLWGPIRESRVGSTNAVGNRLQEPIPRLFYGENDGESFSYIGFNEISWSDDAVVFNTTSVFSTQESSEEALPKYPIGPAQRLVDKLRKSQLFHSWFDENNIEYNSLPALILNGISTSIANRKSGYVAQMALSSTEFDELKVRGGLSSFHHKFVTSREQLSSGSTSEHTYTSDGDTITHYVRNLDASGLDSSAAYKAGTISGGEIQSFSLSETQNTIGTADGISNAYQEHHGGGDSRPEDVRVDDLGNLTVEIVLNLYGAGVGPGKPIKDSNLKQMAKSLEAQWNKAARDFMREHPEGLETNDGVYVSGIVFDFTCKILSDSDAKREIEYNQVVANKYYRVQVGLSDATYCPGEVTENIKKGSTGQLAPKAVKHDYYSDDIFVEYVTETGVPGKVAQAKGGAKFTTISHELCHGFGLVRNSDNVNEHTDLGQSDIEGFLKTRHPIPNSYYQSKAFYDEDKDPESAKRIMIGKGALVGNTARKELIVPAHRRMRVIDMKQMHFEEIVFGEKKDGLRYGFLGGISRRYYYKENGVWTAKTF